MRRVEISQKNAEESNAISHEKVAPCIMLVCTLIAYDEFDQAYCIMVMRFGCNIRRSWLMGERT